MGGAFRGGTVGRRPCFEDVRVVWIVAMLAIAPAVRAADAGTVVCPPSSPTDGSACDGSGTCEYGGDAHGLCSTFATCEVGSWKVYAPAADCGTNGPDCPSSFDGIPSGVVCPLADDQA